MGIDQLPNTVGKSRRFPFGGAGFVSLPRVRNLRLAAHFAAQFPDCLRTCPANPLHLSEPRRQNPLRVIDRIVEQDENRLFDRTGRRESPVIEALAVPDRAGLSPLHRIEAPCRETDQHFPRVAHQSHGELIILMKGVQRPLGPAEGVVVNEAAPAGMLSP